MIKQLLIRMGLMRPPPSAVGRYLVRSQAGVVPLAIYFAWTHREAIKSAFNRLRAGSRTSREAPRAVT